MVNEFQSSGMDVPYFKCIRVAQLIAVGSLMTILEINSPKLFATSNTETHDILVATSVQICICFAFIIIYLVDMICQIGGDPIGLTPMFCFDTISIPLFGLIFSIQIMMYCNQDQNHNHNDTEEIHGANGNELPGNELMAAVLFALVSLILSFLDLVLIFRRKCGYGK